MQQIIKHLVTADRGVAVDYYGGKKVPLYVSVVQLLGVGDATPRPARIVISVEIGGFGLVMYAAGLVQSLSPMTAMHQALESAELAALDLERAYCAQLLDPGAPLQTFEAGGVHYSLCKHGEREAADQLTPGEQRMQEIPAEQVAS